MCGIIGVASANPLKNRQWLKRGMQRLFHRGPDGDGEYWSEDGRVGLGHRRLAIQDLSRLGAQPMLSEDKSIAITFNGEIYNFRSLRLKLKKKGYNFYSDSDTEVLLHAYNAWGKDFLGYLDGMFALAVYDKKKNTVFLARDRAGEKPFVYYCTTSSIYFASELKGLLANKELPRCLNVEALQSYLAFGYLLGDQCILNGYHKLPPGYAIEFSLESGLISKWQYWDLPEYIDEVVDQSLDKHLVDDLESLLQESVNQQLAADVPVGILLSGGVDSSLITAMAVRSTDSVQTFTVSFPTNKSKDESAHARLIASHFGTRHTELPLPTVTPELMAALAVSLDEPLADSSIIPTYLICRTISQQCSVALGGDGADELFGGYHSYVRQTKLVNQLGWVPELIRRILARRLLDIMPLGMKGRGFAEQFGQDYKYGIPWSTFMFDQKTRRAILPMLPENDSAEAFYASLIPRSGDLINRATRFDFYCYLPNDILVKVDRCSMANSLELRSPFLSRKVIDFAFSRVPSRLKATSRNKKILLKRLAERMLPNTFDMQRKQGFTPPLADWFVSESFQSLLKDTILSQDCIFDQSAMESLMARVRIGRNADRILAVVMLELWRREFAVTY